MSNSIRLTALDGSNPLAFLAALGTLRLLTNACPADPPRLHWIQEGTWQPEISNPPCTDAELAQCLLTCPRARAADFVHLGNNLTVKPETMCQFIQSAKLNPELAAFASAFGCEVIKDRLGRVQSTDLCFLTGKSHQDFLGTFAKLEGIVDQVALTRSLFGPWERTKITCASFRWDPDDAVEYAFQFNDPSATGAYSVTGANWLAFHGLPCVPTQPATPRRLGTTAFSRAPHNRSEFRWPIWASPLGLDPTRSLLALRETQQSAPDARALAAIGVVRVFASPRVGVGQKQFEKTSFRPAVAL